MKPDIAPERMGEKDQGADYDKPRALGGSLVPGATQGTPGRSQTQEWESEGDARAPQHSLPSLLWAFPFLWLQTPILPRGAPGLCRGLTPW